MPGPGFPIEWYSKSTMPSDSNGSLQVYHVCILSGSPMKVRGTTPGNSKWSYCKNRKGEGHTYLLDCSNRKEEGTYFFHTAVTERGRQHGIFSCRHSK